LEALVASHPTVGVEEEFLLVDPDTGEPVARNEVVARNAETRGVKLQLELTTCQVETATEVTDTSDELRAELLRLRRVAAEAAEAHGARLLAVGLPPTVPQEFPITDNPRYRRIAELSGMIAHEQGICGCHVHVEVPDRSVAIQVGNRMRPWLPLLLAVTANSAIYRNTDTGYASWRSILWQRWPCAGPPPHFDSADEYDAVVAMHMDNGVMLDDGMIYWDVRPSANFPTIEVRVADVPATVAETVLLAALVRGCVMTAMDAEERGESLAPPAPYSLRAAYWKSARYGLDGDAIDLTERHASVPAVDLLGGLVEHIRPALDAVGDYDMVRAEINRIAEHGNGAMRQRRAWQRGHDIGDVLAEAAAATLE
jgi:carboxylate-amine ligase